MSGSHPVRASGRCVAHLPKKYAELPPRFIPKENSALPLVKMCWLIMECQTVKIYEGGDYRIFLGEVDNAEFSNPIIR